MRINYNVSAMLSNNALSTNDDLLSKSLERLSSGLKINHAKDNPAGLAMSKRMPRSRACPWQTRMLATAYPLSRLQMAP